VGKRGWQTAPEANTLGEDSSGQLRAAALPGRDPAAPGEPQTTTKPIATPGRIESNSFSTQIIPGRGRKNHNETQSSERQLTPRSYFKNVFCKSAAWK